MGEWRINECGEGVLPRRRRCVLAVSMLITLSLLGCSSQTDGQDDSSTAPGETTSGETEPEESTVEIDGRSYTCDEITNSTCGDRSQAVFDAYKDNIDTFVNSDRLGPFLDTSYQDTAYAGIVACTFDDEQEYVAYMQENYEDHDGTFFLPPWFQRGVLCPDLAEGSDGPSIKGFTP